MNEKEDKKPAIDHKKAITAKQESLNKTDGTVVYKTNADEGTGFTLLVNDESVDATVEDGLLWFYVGHELSEVDSIRLK